VEKKTIFALQIHLRQTTNFPETNYVNNVEFLFFVQHLNTSLYAKDKPPFLMMCDNSFFVCCTSCICGISLTFVCIRSSLFFV